MQFVALEREGAKVNAIHVRRSNKPAQMYLRVSQASVKRLQDALHNARCSFVGAPLVAPGVAIEGYQVS
jgi:hypothetical protein